MWIGITLGDVTGIGPEVTLKALAKEAPSDDAHYLIIGDAGYAPLGLTIEPFVARDAVYRWRRSGWQTANS